MNLLSLISLLIMIQIRIWTDCMVPVNASQMKNFLLFFVNVLQRMAMLVPV